MRMDRRAGLLNALKLPTVAELFADMTILTYKGAGTTSDTTPNLDVSEINTTTPYYVFVLTGLALTIVKVTGTTVSSIAYNTTNIGLTISDGTMTADGAWRGYYMVAARFPHYKDADVEQVFGSATITRAAYKNTTATGRTAIPKANIISGQTYVGFIGTTYSASPNRAFFYVAEGSSFPTNVICQNQTTSLSNTLYYLSSNEYIVDYYGGTSGKNCNAQGVFGLQDAS